jgi:purine-binding chemotaxis protein CheW
MSPKAGGGKGPKTKKTKKRKVVPSKTRASKKQPGGKAETTEPTAKTSGLPPSGLAEDILGSLEETDPTAEEEKISTLPAFGLAADVLGTADAEDGGVSPDASETLPSFGLAEDILGVQDTDQEEDQADSQRGDFGLFSESSTQVVAFVIAEEEYALQISEVLEVTHVGEITRVPNAKKYIRGVVNLRGKIIPVVDLKKRLEVGTVEVTATSRIIVVEYGSSVMGLLVDRVSQVYRPALEEIEDPPEEVTSARQNCVRGVFSPAQKKLVFLLDLERTLLASDAAAATSD